MSPNLTQLRTAIALALIASAGVRAADVTVQPAAGSGFVVKNAAGSAERLRVNDNGEVSLPNLPNAPAQAQGLCISGAGLLGPCSGSGGSAPAYTAATGLSLNGTTLSIAPTYQLPQSCTANQIAQWNGTAWACGTASGGATLPAGTVNQTLRYDASNALVANGKLQAFDDGGLAAGGTEGTGSIPATGAGVRMMWYPAKAAFRAGAVAGDFWNDEYVGKGSVAAGYSPIAIGDGSIAMGVIARAFGKASVAIGGNVQADGENSIALGDSSTTDAAAKSSTAIGRYAKAQGEQAMALGSSTEAKGKGSTAIGWSTKANGDYSTAMGYSTTADGQWSMALGSNVGNGGHLGSFIYGDNTHSGQPANDADGQFMVLATGGFKFLTSDGTSVGAKLAPGSGTWTSLSDRNAKTAVVPVDTRAVLDKVAAMPLNTWQYKTQDAKYRHMGPMAQDFHSAFKLGESDTGIDTVDAEGVALAAIQGLNTKLEASNAKLAENVAAKDAEIAVLRERLTAQDTRLAALESATRDLAGIKRLARYVTRLPRHAASSRIAMNP